MVVCDSNIRYFLLSTSAAWSGATLYVKKEDQSAQSLTRALGTSQEVKAGSRAIAFQTISALLSLMLLSSVAPLRSGYVKILEEVRSRLKLNTS